MHRRLDLLLLRLACHGAAVLLSGAWQWQPASSFAPPQVQERRIHHFCSSVPTQHQCRQSPLQTTFSTRRRNLPSHYSHGGTQRRLLPLDMQPLESLTVAVANVAAATSATTATDASDVAATTGLSPTTTIIVFIVGVIPFAWATIEFWRRIAVGASFGTGADSVVFSTIGQDDAPESSRGRRVLGKGALVVAYVLFAIAAGVLGLVLWSVLTTPLPPSSM